MSRIYLYIGAGLVRLVGQSGLVSTRGCVPSSYTYYSINEYWIHQKPDSLKRALAWLNSSRPQGVIGLCSKGQESSDYATRFSAVVLRRKAVRQSLFVSSYRIQVYIIILTSDAVSYPKPLATTVVVLFILMPLATLVIFFSIAHIMIIFPLSP